MRRITDDGRAARLLAALNALLHQAPETAVPASVGWSDAPPPPDAVLLLWRHHDGGVTTCAAGRVVPPSAASRWRTYVEWYDCGVVATEDPRGAESTSVARAVVDAATGAWRVIEVLATGGAVQPLPARTAERMRGALRLPSPLPRPR
jgi:hypothetical protein